MGRLVFSGLAFALSMGSAFAEAKANDIEKIGAWELVTITDPISDESRSIGILSNGASFIGVKCDKPGLDSIYIQFSADEYLGGSGGRSGFRNLTYRFDQGTPTIDRWRYNSSYAIQTDRSKVSQFVSLLSSSNRIVIRATTYEHREVTQIFETSAPDTHAVLLRVYESCRAGVAPIALSATEAATPGNNEHD